MIFYVATYPRCGSGVLRQALRRNFGRLTSNGYVAVLDAAADAGEPELGWALHPQMPELAAQPVVLEPALPRLTPQVRARLAARPEALFVKTHEPPFERWFPGERAIQMVRHPGAAMTSFCNLKRQANPQITLERFVARPDWASYHLAWMQARVPIVRLRYEDLFDDPALIGLLEGFTGLSPLNRALETLAQANARNPGRNPGLGLDGWRAQMSPQAYATLARVNGAVAAELGYRLDD